MGTLLPGQSAQLKFPNTFGTSSPVYSLYQATGQYGRGGFPIQSGASLAQRAQQRKRDLINSLINSLPNFNAGGFNPFLQAQILNSSVVALGWSNSPLLSYSVNGKVIGGNDLALFVSELRLDLEQSQQLLPSILYGKVIEKTNLPFTSPSGANPNPAAYLPPLPVNGAVLEAGNVIVGYDLPQLETLLKGQGKKLDRLTIEAPAHSYNRQGYGGQQPLKYKVELFNFQAGKWEEIPTVLGPFACLNQASGYRGGPISNSLTSLNSPGPGASAACLSAFGKAPAPPSSPTISSVPSQTPGASSGTAPAITSLLPATTTSAPLVPGPGFSSGSSFDGFSVMQAGPGFDPAQYLGPGGKIRVRFSREGNNTDLIFWNYFSIGYELLND